MGKRKRHEPNAQEQRSNEEHASILPVLEKAWAAIQDNGSSLTATPVAVYQSGKCVELRPQECPGAQGSVDWAALDKMKRIVKPKFKTLDGEDAVDLFGRIHKNTSSSSVKSQAYESVITIPARSSFLMSDVSQLGPLLRSCEKEGRFDVILVDPPWENKSVWRGGKYSTIPNRGLDRLPIIHLLAKDGLVCFWMTNRMKILDYFKSVQLPKWNLRIVAVWYWLKTDETGKLVSSLDINHRRPYERLFLTRSLDSSYDALEEEGSRFLHNLVIVSKRREHSRKPWIHPLLEQMSKGGNRFLEMFSRELSPGWTCWGNEVLKFQCQ